MEPGVAPDGSPVAIYLALPPGDTPELITATVAPGASILELGSGPGRITHPLVEKGHEVVAVDDSGVMLEHVRGAETVLGDVFSLDLGRRFHAVVAASHLINDPRRQRRLRLLDVCRRHVAAGGAVLIERYRPEWAMAPGSSQGDIGDVSIRFEPLEVGETGFTARVTYTLGQCEWAQEFSAAVVTDEMLDDEAREAGLALDGWIDDARTWARLVET